MPVTKEESALARVGFEVLRAEQLKSRNSGNLRLAIKYGAEIEIELPPPAVEALTAVLEHLANGEDVTISAKPVELTTQKAADYLRVSRPFFIKLLETGEIPFRKVGTHRRVLFSDLKSYKEAIDSERLKVLEELSGQAQELKMGY